MTATLRLRGVRKSYRHDGRDQVVLPGVDLDVGSAEVVALVGPSGCGKTTLLRVLAGLEEPDGGEVELDPRRAELRVAVVFQHYALYPWLTAERNIALPVELVHGVGRRAARRVAREWLDRVGLTAFRDHHPARLSGGMRQRVALARGLALDPHLLLMDEPFAAVDATTRTELHTLTQRLFLTHAPTTVLVTHDPLEAALLADRVLVLSRHGHVVAEHRVGVPRPRDFDDLLTAPLAEVVHAIRHH